MKTQEALDFTISEFQKKYGKDEKLKNGDELVTVFPDGVMFIGFNNGDVNMKIVIGKPFHANFNIIEEGDLTNE